MGEYTRLAEYCVFLLVNFLNEARLYKANITTLYTPDTLAVVYVTLRGIMYVTAQRERGNGRRV